MSCANFCEKFHVEPALMFPVLLALMLSSGDLDRLFIRLMMNSVSILLADCGSFAVTAWLSQSLHLSSIGVHIHDFTCGMLLGISLRMGGAASTGVTMEESATLSLFFTNFSFM